MCHFFRKVKILSTFLGLFWKLKVSDFQLDFDELLLDTIMKAVFVCLYCLFAYAGAGEDKLN